MKKTEKNNKVPTIAIVILICAAAFFFLSKEQEIKPGKIESPEQSSDYKHLAMNLQVNAENALKEIEHLTNYNNCVEKLTPLFHKARNQINNSSWESAYDLLVSITNECNDVLISHQYNIIKQNFSNVWVNADRKLLMKLFNENIKSIGGKVKQAELYCSSDSIILYQTAYDELTNIILHTADENQKNKYNDLLNKAVTYSKQKKWFKAKNVAQQAIATGYQDSSKAEKLLEKIKTQFVPEIGSELSIDLGNGVMMEFVGIPPGNFKMGDIQIAGDSDERPVHNVNFQKGFWMCKYEVTQKQYQQITGENPSSFKRSGENAPVENICWNDAKDFCERLSDKTKLEIRLPSEAEWEYACRAGTTTKYCSGNEENDLKRTGWFLDNSGRQTHQCGLMAPNAFGLYDMHGNVYEWCEDRAHTSYDDAPDDGSAWVLGSDLRCVVRGGSWSLSARSCRSASRIYNSPEHTSSNNGFRLILVVL